MVVNLRTDKAIQGVLWAQRGPLLVIRSSILHDSGRQTPVDGGVIVERSNVDFVQVIPAGEP